MTQEELAERLRQLVGEAEDAGSKLPWTIEVLEHQIEAMQMAHEEQPATSRMVAGSSIRRPDPGWEDAEQKERRPALSPGAVGGWPVLVAVVLLRLRPRPGEVEPVGVGLGRAFDHGHE